MNEKVFYQLLDTVRGSSLLTNGFAQSLILQLLCWWKLSKEGRIPEEVRFDAWAFKPIAAQLEALRKAQASLPYPFIDEASWQASLKKLNDLRPVSEKILQLEAQGFLDNLDLRDAGFWIAGEPTSDMAISPSLADLVVALAKLKSGDDAYVPWDRSGQLAARSVNTGATTWVETHNPALLSPLLCASANTDWTLRVTEPIANPLALEKGQLKQFGHAVCFPPMGLRYRPEVISNDLLGRFTEKSPVGDVLQIRHLLAQVNGRIVAVVSKALLYGAGSERQLREHLVETGLVEAVISMPAGLCTHTSLPVVILVLNTAQPSKLVRFVNADHDDFRTVGAKRKASLTNLDKLIALVDSSEQTEMAASVSSATIAANDYNLEASRYILDDKARRLAAVFKEHTFVPLAEHFEIIRPRQHATASSGPNVFEVQTLDLPEFGYLTQASKEALFDLESPKANTYFLRDKDILLSFRGAIGKVAIAKDAPPAGEDGWIAGQSFVILRAGEQAKYPPEALVVYLRSQIGQALLNRIAVGATMASIQLSALKELEIPIPSPDEMNRMVQAFEQEAQIQSQIQQLRDKQTTLAASFWRL